MKVFISAPRQKRFFIECVKEVVAEREDKWFYPPDEFRDLDDKQIFDKVSKELWLSNLVLMDVSMKCFDGECYPNSGVMIEFGLLMNDPRKGLGYVYFFCDESTERSDLPPMIPRVDITPYSENEENRDDFKEVIRQALEGFVRKSPDREQQARGAKVALERLYKLERESTPTT